MILRIIRGHKKGSASVKIALILAAAAGGAALVYAGTRGAARNSNIKVVRIAPGLGIEIIPALAQGKPPRSETFSEMIARLRPYAAINGTFYDGRMRPLGDVVIGGKLVNRGAYRNAVAVTSGGRIVFRRRGKGRFDWSGYRSGLAAGPRLVHRGRIALDPVPEGFKRESLSIRAWRSGVGMTADGGLLLVTVEETLTLAEFADVMLDLGAVEAMNLDGGGACALYHRGNTIVHPTLAMTNLLVVHKGRN